MLYSLKMRDNKKVNWTPAVGDGSSGSIWLQTSLSFTYSGLGLQTTVIALMKFRETVVSNTFRSTWEISKQANFYFYSFFKWLFHFFKKSLNNVQVK